MAFDPTKAAASFKAMKEREEKKRQSALKYIRAHNYIIDGEDVRYPGVVPDGYQRVQLNEATMIEYAKALRNREKYRNDGSGREVKITWYFLNGNQPTMHWAVKVPQTSTPIEDDTFEY